MRVFGSSILFLALVQTSYASSEPAQSDRFTPARFGTHSDSVISNLRCPSEPSLATDAVVFCRAQITPSGKPRRSYCFTHQQERTAYQSLTNRAIDKSTFIPASINGESVDVLFSFRVAFSWSGDNCTFAAIPNWGFDDPDRDLNYTAPQEILPKGIGWLDRTGLFTPGTGATGDVRAGIRPPGMSRGNLRRGVVFTMSTLVSDEGVPTDARLENNLTATDAEIRRSLQAILQSKFIPGFRDNKPIEMRYFDVYYVEPIY